MKRLHLLILSFLLGWTSFVTADSSHYDDNDFSISNFDTVAEAVASITTTLEDQGMEIVSVFDHSANATKVGLELPPTQLILFRNHRLEKKLLHKSSTVAIDLPQMIQVWRDKKTDELKLLYNPAGYRSKGSVPLLAYSSTPYSHLITRKSFGAVHFLTALFYKTVYSL